MSGKAYLFIDRDGTLIHEPEDYQVDSLGKVALLDHVIPALLELKKAGFVFVMVSNQDGLGTDSFPEVDFHPAHDLVLHLFNSQGIEFEEVLICPHMPEDRCSCRKPEVGMMLEYLRRTDWDRENSYVIGDRDTDMQLADNMGLDGIRISDQCQWPDICSKLLTKDRTATVRRKTAETDIQCQVNLDQAGNNKMQSGIGFFDHMLEQLAKHGGFSMQLECRGDTHIDDHHTVEDVGITIGQALKKALGDKRGIGRYGFTLPMDEVLAEAALDLSGRPLFVFDGEFSAEQVGEMSTQMLPHFFRSLCDHLGANLHLKISNGNAHHQAEGAFKVVARCLGQAIARQGHELPSTKGVL